MSDKLVLSIINVLVLQQGTSDQTQDSVWMSMSTTEAQRSRTAEFNQHSEVVNMSWCPGGHQSLLD